MGKIDIARHRELEADGYLYLNRHEDAPLLIHNYSPKTQYERFWTPETLMSRGLITDLEGNIIARPFPKFFNLDEHISQVGLLPEEPFDVFEKMDGSLGILYFALGRPRIATRGSFASDQSKMAEIILAKKYAHVEFDPSITYLFEIIYPENRIVVDYAGLEDLVLLGMIDTKTGAELPIVDLGIPMVPRYDGVRDLEALRALEKDNMEGFVVRFHGGLRVKVKFEEYVRLHRILTGINSRNIWEHMQEGQDMDEILEKVPDEFYNWVRKVQADLRAKFSEIEEQAKSEFRTFPTRKEAAAYFFAETTYPAIMFRMLDGRSYDEIIWKMIRPEHQKAFALSDEEQ